MSEYKVIFRIASNDPESENQTRWEPGCPLLFEAVQVSRNTETGQAFLQARIKNISAEEVSSFTAKLSCTFSDGSTAEFATSPLDADILPWCDYTLAPIELPRGDAESADAQVLSADTPSGTWKSENEPLSMPSRRKLDLSQEELAERSRQLEQLGCEKAAEAASHKLDDHGAWTLCPCGRVSVGFARCPACGLPFQSSIQWEDREHLAEEQAKQNTASSRERTRQNKELKTGIGIALVAVLALCIVATCISTCDRSQDSATHNDPASAQTEQPSDRAPKKTDTLAEEREFSGSTEDFIQEVRGNLSSLTEGVSMIRISGQWGIMLGNEAVGIVETDESKDGIGFFVMGDEDANVGAFAYVVGAALMVCDPTIDESDIESAIQPLIDEQRIVRGGVEFEIGKEDELYALIVTL